MKKSVSLQTDIDKENSIQPLLSYYSFISRLQQKNSNTEVHLFVISRSRIVGLCTQEGKKIIVLIPQSIIDLCIQ